MLHRVVEAIANPRKAGAFVRSRAKEYILWDRYYAALRDPKSIGRVVNDPAATQAIVDELQHRGIRVEETTIDLLAFKRYLQDADYPSYWPYYDGGRAPKFIEKALEHYLAAWLLDLDSADVYIDIATDRSPAPAIYQKLHGCVVYRQDLAFPDGVHGDRIGGNAAAMPVTDGFATKLALHCSFEHFEGDSDSRFIREANRVLRPGGRACIVPLYLSRGYAIQTNPALMGEGGIEFDSDAILYCARGWRNRHNRYYDVAHFCDRVVDHLGDFGATIHVIQNEQEIDRACYAKFVLVLQKP